MSIRSLSKWIFVGFAVFAILVTQQPTGIAQTQEDSRDIRTLVYPVVISEEKLQIENSKLRKQKRSILLSCHIAGDLVCVYAVHEKKSTSYILENMKDILGANTEKILHESALKNFLAIMDASPSMFVSKDVDLFNETMLLVYVPVSAITQKKRTDPLVDIRSFILTPGKLIHMAEEEFGSPMPEEGYLLLVFRGELLIAEPDNWNTLRLRVFVDRKIRDKESEIFLSQKIYRLNHQGIEALFKHDIKFFSQTG